ncbi:tryptophan-rich antigen, putative, partial [Hepatocystis sp. ex Piliocolobus tephrosceles]
NPFNSENMEQAENPFNSENMEQAENPFNSENMEQSENPFNSENMEQAENPFNSENMEQAENPFNSENMEQAENPFNSENMEQAENPFNSENMEQAENPFNSENMEQAENPFDEKPSKLIGVISSSENNKEVEHTVLEVIPEVSSSIEEINKSNETIAEPVVEEPEDEKQEDKEPKYFRLATTNKLDYSPSTVINEAPSDGSSMEVVTVEKEDNAKVEPNEKAPSTLFTDNDLVVAIPSNKPKPTVKINKISKWMETEEKLYFNKIKNMELKWKTEKIEEIKYFLLYLEKRWLSYKGNVDTKVSKDFEKKSLSWQDDQWKNWIYSEGTDLLINQFNMWLKFGELELKYDAIENFKDWVLEKEYTIDAQSWSNDKKVKKLNKFLKNAQTMQNEVHKHVDNFHKPVNKKLFNTFVIWKNDFIKRWLKEKIYNSWLNEIHN